jgi:hypothetical protein
LKIDLYDNSTQYQKGCKIKLQTLQQQKKNYVFYEGEMEEDKVAAAETATAYQPQQ